jgi:GNAT superfamily N-acetyltransferase
MVRAARPDDVPVILDLIRVLAVYEREPPETVQATEESLHECLFGNQPTVFAHLAVHDDAGGSTVAGMALWYLSFSTWTGRNGVYLEDLVVRDEFRGLGYGRALIQKLAALCVERGYPRLEWSVLNWNAPSIGFYERLGAVAMDDWTRYRLDERSLSAVVGGA